MAATMEPINTALSSPLLTPAPPSASSSTGPGYGYPSPPATAAADEPSASEDESHRGRSKFPMLTEPEFGEDSTATEKLQRRVGQPTRTTTAGQSRRRGTSGSTNKSTNHDNVPRLSAAEIQELASSPDSLPIAPAPERLSIDQEMASRIADQRDLLRQQQQRQHRLQSMSPARRHPDNVYANGIAIEPLGGVGMGGIWQVKDPVQRPYSPRTLSTPPNTRVQQRHPADGGSAQSTSPRRNSFNPQPRPPSLSLNVDGATANGAAMNGYPMSPAIHSARTPVANGPPTPKGPPSYVGPNPPSPIPAMIPLPPMSLPTHLQLELAAQRPSPLYIHQSHSNDIPYESYALKLERLKNVLLLAPYLERALYFGALACLDAWLYTFTILPIRFFFAVGLLIKWWVYVASRETRWLVDYVKNGLGRLWERGRTDQSRRPSDVSEQDRSRSCSRVREPSSSDATGAERSGVSAAALRDRLQHTRIELPADGGNDLIRSPVPGSRGPGPRSGSFRHRRTKSMPSSLSQFHKADLLQGAVIICSSLALMTLDASRMYHFIRAQSAIKLYVIYNILEVGDRLLSAIGQDILECLFSNETLSRNSSGRSKVLLPLGMFVLALLYNCLHSIALYYQVITLNVAVNSYSNALLTLLLSNQFVEIKSTVFKRFDKDNLFQLTCADIVERFHLWIMLLIIGMRNIVEVGALSVPGAGYDSTQDDGNQPLHPPSILPYSFTVLPKWLMSGEVLSPFLIVLGSEMLVDAIKHAYVTKFNNIKPTFYGRTLDILCKDYYTNAFVTPSLTRRLGLAVIPLSCLFIRASVQTYHMFLSTHVSQPLPPSTQTSLTEESAVPSSPAMMAALSRFDALIRDSLGRATYGYPYGSPLNSRPWYAWTSDDFIAALTMVVVFFIVFLVLLILKLLLGMLLLKYSRARYAKMKAKENLVALGKLELESYDTKGRRVGGRGDVELTEDKKRWIHADPSEGLKGGKGPTSASDGGKKGGLGIEESTKKTKKKIESDYMGVARYEMVAKRIW